MPSLPPPSHRAGQRSGATELVVTPSDLDLLETVLACAPGAAPRLGLDVAGMPDHVAEVDLLDAENTPVARARLASEPVDGAVRIESLTALRPIAPLPGPLGDPALRGTLAGATALRRTVLVHRVPTTAELDGALARLVGADDGHGATQPLWVVPAARTELGADPVAQAAARGLLALREAGGLPGEIAVVPSWRPGHGRLRVLDDLDPMALVAASGLGQVVAVVGEPDSAPHGGPDAVTRTALTAAYPADTLPALTPGGTHRDTGLVVLFTGYSGSGKSTVAKELVARLCEHDGRDVTLLDGDEVRRLLSAGLGFDRASRDLNIARIGFVAALVARHGGIAVAAPIAPFAAARADVRRRAEAVGEFLLVHVSTSLEVCEQRDRKGLYARARAGEIPDFTGISSPYEAPEDADVVVDTAALTVEAAVDEVLAALRLSANRSR